MDFDSDVFISYAHLDNQSLTAGSQGWVSDFHEALSKRLGEVWGRAPRIWRDPKLQGNDVFAEELDQRYKRAAVLVSVITPRYVESDWCKRELTGFWQAADGTGGAVVGTKARVFKVVKTPVQRERLPEPAQPLLGYEFFQIQPGNGRPLEFNRVYGPEAERDFWMRLNDLAYDLTELLQMLQARSAGSGATPKPLAYLATTTTDQAARRDQLRRELLRQGYGVLPDIELPLLAAEVDRVVPPMLQRCCVAVHLAGSAWGVVPEGGNESLPAQQARLASAQARSGGLARLVWVAPEAAQAAGPQQAWLAALRDDPVPAATSDLLETPFDELQATVLARLKAAEQPPPPARPAAAPAVARIYLLCDLRDLDAVLPLRQQLFDAGHEVVLPAFEGDDAQLRTDHDTQLRDCDAVLVYYGAGNEAWLRQMLTGLRGLPAMQRSAVLRAAAICVADPATPAKKLLMTREAMVIQMSGGYSAAALAPFLAALQPKPAP